MTKSKWIKFCCNIGIHDWKYSDLNQFNSDTDAPPRMEYAQRECIKCGRVEKMFYFNIYGKNWRRVK